MELTGPGLPKLTLLSPTPDRLRDLYKVWARELERLRRKERYRVQLEPATTRGELPSIEALAARVTPTDKAVPNGSSIAMMLEHQGASVLLSADAFPTVLVPALAALAKRRGVAGPLPHDAVKLSHQGGRANVTQDLLKAVDARHFVFSTNNMLFPAPERGGRGPGHRRRQEADPTRREAAPSDALRGSTPNTSRCITTWIRRSR